MKLLEEEQSTDNIPVHGKYYRDLVAASDIGEVARELIRDRITEETSEKLYCDCPRHTSISRKSLQVDLKMQLWKCWGCNLGGDVIQFVEFIQTGHVSKGVKGPQPDSHRTARNYLAARAKMPILGESGLSQEEMEENRERPKEKRSPFNKLLDLFHTSGSVAFIDQYDSGWATMKIEDHYENIRISSPKFTRTMLNMYFAAYGEAVAHETIELVGELLTARAAETRHLYNRYAWVDDRLLIDLCRPDWRVIEVSAEGWKITEETRPLFRRFSHQRPMPLPNKGGEIRKVLGYLTVKDTGNQALLLVWLCTCMLEYAPRPGLIIYGIQGSSKTTAAEFLRWIVDPSVILTSSLSTIVLPFRKIEVGV